MLPENRKLLPANLMIETQLPPLWTSLSQSYFLPESLGFALFPEGLEGRLRPETVFDRLAVSLFNPSNHTARAWFEAAGIITCQMPCPNLMNPLKIRSGR